MYPQDQQPPALSDMELNWYLGCEEETPVLNSDGDAIDMGMLKEQKYLRRKRSRYSVARVLSGSFPRMSTEYGGQPEPLTTSNFAAEQKRIVLTYLAAAADPC